MEEEEEGCPITQVGQAGRAGILNKPDSFAVGLSTPAPQGRKPREELITWKMKPFFFSTFLFRALSCRQSDEDSPTHNERTLGVEE